MTNSWQNEVQADSCPADPLLLPGRQTVVALVTWGGVFCKHSHQNYFILPAILFARVATLSMSDLWGLGTRYMYVQKLDPFNVTFFYGDDFENNL